MKAGPVIAVCIMSAINLILFILLISRMSPVEPIGGTSHLYDAISLQITILTLVLGAVALGLAGAAFFGYKALEEAVERRADKLWNQRLQNWQNFQPPEGSPPGLMPSQEQIEEESAI